MKLPKIHIVKKSRNPGEEITDGGFDAWNIMLPILFRCPARFRGAFFLEFGIYKRNPDYNPWTDGGDMRWIKKGMLVSFEIFVPIVFVRIEWPPRKFIKTRIIK